MLSCWHHLPAPRHRQTNLTAPNPPPTTKPPAAHLFNFKFVPSQYRVAYNNVVSIGWLALLSAITHAQGSGLMTAALGHLHHLGGGGGH
jgi:hypothetical protein